MSRPQSARRVIALAAAYGLALQALLLPLSVAAGSPMQTGLCSERTGAPVQHDTGCACAAGCGMQCHAQSLLAPPHPGLAIRRTGAVIIAPPVALDSIVRLAQRGPHSPRAPPAA